MKQLLKYGSAISFLILLMTFTVRAQEILDKYLVVAAGNNPGLKKHFNEYMAALETAPQVSALPDPELAFGYFISPVQTRVGPQQFRFSATQMFPWFGTLGARENVAVQTARAKYESFREARSRLFNEVRSTYYNLYYNSSATEIVRQNISILNTLQKLTLIKVEGGQVSALDEYRIEMEIGDLENHLALLLDKQEALETAFFNLLNSEAEPLVIPDTLWDEGLALTRQEILDSIMSRNHGLLSLDMQTQALEYKVELAEKAGKPDFGIGFDYIITGRGENNLSGQDAVMFPRIAVTIPLYRDKYRSMVREAAFRVSAMENEKEDTENMLGTLFANTWKELMDAGRRMGLYREQLLLAERSMNLLETEYATANRNFEEILRMERKVLFYALELEKARADRQAAVSFIKYLMGK